jgi:hypothetical protein
MTLNCVVFNKNEIHRPISFIDKLSSDFDLLKTDSKPFWMALSHLKRDIRFESVFKWNEIWLNRGLVSQYQPVYLLTFFDSYEKLHR